MALNNSQYESIIKGYERARDESRFLLDSRKQQVWREIPEYRNPSAPSPCPMAGACWRGTKAPCPSCM